LRRGLFDWACNIHVVFEARNRACRVEYIRDRTRIGEHVVNLGYDPPGAVAALTLDAHAPLSFERDALGREIRRESAAGFYLEAAYGPAGQLTRQVAASKGRSARRRPASRRRSRPKSSIWVSLSPVFAHGRTVIIQIISQDASASTTACEKQGSRKGDQAAVVRMKGALHDVFRCPKQ
jgi:hypothetical protein